MGKIFYNKKLAVLFVALAIIVVFLLFILLTSLTQLATMNSKMSEVRKLIEAAQTDSQSLEALKEYRQTNEYVIEWAIKNGKLTQDQIKWLETQK